MSRPPSESRLIVVGAGIAGLATALELAERGIAVEVVDRGERLGAASCSWAAGGMLAPWCERENADEAVVTHGVEALDWWPRRFPETVGNGTLVVAAARDASEIARFARRTSHFEEIDAARIAALEPDLAGRFSRGLFFPEEAHLDPRKALAALEARLGELGVPVRFGVELDPAAPGPLVDCRGFAARDALAELRGVRGEMLILRCRDVTLSRPVRLLHPRIPLYIVPRDENRFMVGATMIESADRGRATVRSAVELMNAAYALHPAFGEAEILEICADVRPAFPDNLPRVERRGDKVYLNGLYRHGFLLTPAFAARAAEAAIDMIGGNDEDHRQRRSA